MKMQRARVIVVSGKMRVQELSTIMILEIDYKFIIVIITSNLFAFVVLLVCLNNTFDDKVYDKASRLTVSAIIMS